MYPLFKPKHPVEVFAFIAVLFARLRIVRIGMGAIEEFHDVKSALVDIEMDVSRLKVRHTGLPDLCFRIKAFDFLPGNRTDAFAVCRWVDEQEIQMIVLRLFMDRQDKSSDDPAGFPDTVGSTVIDAVFNGFYGK